MNSHRSSHTHCQAPQAQAQTNFCDKREQKQTCLTMPSKAKISEAKACQRVCLPQPREKCEAFTNTFKNQINIVRNFKIFLPRLKGKIKTRQSASSRTGTRATQTEKKMK